MHCSRRSCPAAERAPDRPDLYAAIKRDHKWRGRANQAGIRAALQLRLAKPVNIGKFVHPVAVISARAGGRGAVRAVELSRPVREYRESAGTAGAAVLDPTRARVGAAGELVIPGCAHWVAEQAPEELLAALTAFLAPYRSET